MQIHSTAFLDCNDAVTGVDIRYQVEGRRAGDPARLVANAAGAREALGWAPAYTDLGPIVATA